uniref:Uncharacterized protein n=1 Tax=Arundo donax TaxID=35708 RepID=A0A0A8ZS70_ARUDO
MGRHGGSLSPRNRHSTLGRTTNCSIFATASGGAPAASRDSRNAAVERTTLRA